MRATRFPPASFRADCGRTGISSRVHFHAREDKLLAGAREMLVSIAAGWRRLYPCREDDHRILSVIPGSQ